LQIELMCALRNRYKHLRDEAIQPCVRVFHVGTPDLALTPPQIEFETAFDPPRR
jgi:hypothetical protein